MYNVTRNKVIIIIIIIIKIYLIFQEQFMIKSFSRPKWHLIPIYVKTCHTVISCGLRHQKL